MTPLDALLAHDDFVRLDPRDSWFIERRDVQADADGIALVASEDPGLVVLYAIQGGSQRAEVRAGVTTDVTLTIQWTLE